MSKRSRVFSSRRLARGLLIRSSMQAKHILLLFFPIAGFADVNMRDASFIHSVNEFTHPAFSKTYNSRSLYKGSFGSGWCAEFEKTLSPKDGTRYHCGRKTQIRVRPEKEDWVSELPDGSLEVYDQKGRLKALKIPGHPLAKFKYGSKDQIINTTVKKKTYTLEYDSRSGQIVEIKDSSLHSVRYKYKDETLTEIQGSGKKALLQRYIYDSFHNMIEIQFNNQKIEEIQYETKTDEIKSILASNGCIENYKFQKVSQTELKSSIERSCPSSLPQKKTFSFTAKRTPQGSLVLEKIRIAGGKNGTSTLP